MEQNHDQEVESSSSSSDVEEEEKGGVAGGKEEEEEEEERPIAVKINSPSPEPTTVRHPSSTPE